MFKTQPTIPKPKILFYSFYFDNDLTELHIYNIIIRKTKPANFVIFTNAETIQSLNNRYFEDISYAEMLEDLSVQIIDFNEVLNRLKISYPIECKHATELLSKINSCKMLTKLATVAFAPLILYDPKFSSYTKFFFSKINIVFSREISLCDDNYENSDFKLSITGTYKDKKDKPLWDNNNVVKILEHDKNYNVIDPSVSCILYSKGPIGIKIVTRHICEWNKLKKDRYTQINSNLTLSQSRQQAAPDENTMYSVLNEKNTSNEIFRNTKVWTIKSIIIDIFITCKREVIIGIFKDLYKKQYEKLLENKSYVMEYLIMLKRNLISEIKNINKFTISKTYLNKLKDIGIDILRTPAEEIVRNVSIYEKLCDDDYIECIHDEIQNILKVLMQIRDALDNYTYSVENYESLFGKNIINHFDQYLYKNVYNYYVNVKDLGVIGKDVKWQFNGDALYVFVPVFTGDKL